MKKLLCKLFGHQPPIYKKKGWYSPGEEYATYATISPDIMRDGTGRLHAVVWSDCPRCKMTFKLCRIHLPKEK